MTGTQTYNAEAIAKLKSWLGAMAEKGHKKFYEIFVDNARVVHKTDDLADFDDHEMWVDNTTKVIRVLVYSSEGSHRYQPFEYRTEFYLNELEQAKQKSELKLQQSLSGLDVDKKIETALSKQKQEFEFENLKKENISLKEKVKEAEEYIDDLEDKIEVFESQKFKLNQDTIVSVGSGILSAVVKSNPDIISKIPPAALNGLASVIASSNASNTNESEVTIKKKPVVTEASYSKQNDPEDEKESEEEEEDEETQLRMAFLEQLQEKLNEKEFNMVFGMMTYLMENPKQIHAAFDLVIPTALKKAA